MSRKHRDVIAIERDETQQVQVTISEPTGGGREVEGGYSQLFNRVMQSGIFAALPLPARAVYTALVYLGDNTRHFIVDGKDGKGVNIDRIMAVSGCGETAVKQAIRTLDDRQLIRILRKGGSMPDGTRFASIYQLLLPVAGFDHLHKNLPPEVAPRRDTTRYPGASRPGTRSSRDPVPDRRTTQNPGAKRGSTGSQNVRSNRTDRKVDSSRQTAAAAEDSDEQQIAARDLLVERGVGEPLLTRILDSSDPTTIERHVLDFDLRNKLAGQARKTAGWLVKSILAPYALHERTLAVLEERTRSAQAKQHHRLKAIEKELEDERLAAIDAWAEEQFASADDEELETLRAKVVAEYGSVARGLEHADPRTHPRLSRLIKGVLSQMYQPPV